MLARSVSSLDAHLQAELEAVAEQAPAVAAPGQSPAMEMASSVGNRGMGQVISRMHDGEGILPSGIAHPVVESTIAAVTRRRAPARRTRSPSSSAARSAARSPTSACTPTAPRRR